MTEEKEQRKDQRSTQPGIPEDPKITLAMSHIRHKILVISNKGGVGKSMLSVNLAVALGLRKKAVGLLDIDIHGPSITKMLGIDNPQESMQVVEQKIVPAEAYGIKVVGMGFLLGDSDAPVIWRGPMKTNVIRQFLGDVSWGDLDYLIIDSPPGTGDEPLTICQMIPRMDGAIIITTAQEIALLDSRKAVRFAQKLNVPVLGIVENMGWLTCPKCGERIELFGHGNGEQIAARLGINYLGTLPFDPQIVVAGDSGRPIVLDSERSEAGKVLHSIVDRVVELMS